MDSFPNPRMKAFFLTLLLCFSPTVDAIDLNKSVEVGEGLAASYGYVFAQDLALAKIQEEFPQLGQRANSVRAQFLLKFPSAEKMRSALLQVLGDDILSEIERRMIPQLQSQVLEQEYSFEMSKQFLDLVKRRSRGEIEEPILDWLLTVRFLNNPSAEVRAGFKSRFESKGHDKSQGLDLVLSVPKSWKPAEGERPHVVQKWVSQVGHGPQMLMLIINDTEGYTPSDIELQNEISNGLAEDITPPGFHLLEDNAITLENRTVLRMRLLGKQERLDISLQMYATWYVLFYRGKMITLQCMASSLEGSNTHLDQDGEVVDDLCQVFANSLVLNTEYP